MSHDNRFPKTNYLKTNLLKQIKKISLPSLRMILSFIYDAKLQKNTISCTLNTIYLFFFNNSYSTTLYRESVCHRVNLSDSTNDLKIETIKKIRN